MDWEMTDKRSAKVTVCTPCTCGEKHSRWFYCRTAKVVAAYDCQGFEDRPSSPLPRVVEEIKRCHPGMDLIFNDDGAPEIYSYKKAG